MISPTVGRVVWYYPEAGEMNNYADQPFMAGVCYVHNDTLVNLKIVDHEGNGFAKTNVHLCQDAEVPKEGQCGWMPYQKGQAAATEAALLAAKPA